jgi:hypothetical protein
MSSLRPGHKIQPVKKPFEYRNKEKAIHQCPKKKHRWRNDQDLHEMPENKVKEQAAINISVLTLHKKQVE